MKRIVYVDTSALLRVVFNEPGPRVPLDAKSSVATSRLSVVEAARAIERARLSAQLNDLQTVTSHRRVADLFSRCHVVAIDDAIWDLAVRAFGVAVRSLDAIHVATAQRLAELSQAPVTVWTHDDRMAEAALARGLDVEGR